MTIDIPSFGRFAARLQLAHRLVDEWTRDDPRHFRGQMVATLIPEEVVAWAKSQGLLGGCFGPLDWRSPDEWRSLFQECGFIYARQEFKDGRAVSDPVLNLLDSPPVLPKPVFRSAPFESRMRWSWANSPDFATGIAQKYEPESVSELWQCSEFEQVFAVFEAVLRNSDGVIDHQIEYVAVPKNVDRVS